MLPPQHPERKLRVLLCGYGHLGMALLEGLLARVEDCEVIGVFRWSARPGSRHFREPAEEQFQRGVARSGLREIHCSGVNTFAFTALLEELQPDVVLVGSWGEIFRPHILEMPGILFINCHPSLLPAHRGPNPYSSVILQGENQTGVTFHRMSPRIDAGAILLQQIVPLNGDETGAGVRERCVAEARRMTSELLDALKAHILDGEPLTETPQDEALQSYFPLLRAEDARINWALGVDALDSKLRALFPWMPCYSYLDGKIPVMLHTHRLISMQTPIGEDILPGTILEYDQGRLRIALSDPLRILESSRVQVACGQTPLSFWLSGLLAPLLFRPGAQLRDPGI